MSPSARRSVALAALGVVIAVAAAAARPSRAAAYEDQLTLGLGLGYAVVATETLPAHGALVELSASIGLDDIWTIRGYLSYALHPGSDPLHVGIGGAELVYALDILEVVPFFGLGADAITTIYRGDPGVDFAAHIVLGVDYLPARTWLIGLDIRPYALFTRLSTDPVYVTVSGRVSLMFDL